MDKNRLKENLIVVIIGVLLFVGLTHMSTVLGGLGYVLGLFMPLVVGGVIAFILNLPLRAMEEKWFHKTTESCDSFGWLSVTAPGQNGDFGRLEAELCRFFS